MNVMEVFANNLSSFYIIICFTILSVPAKKPEKTHIDSKQIFIACLITLTLIELVSILNFPNDYQKINDIFHMISGIIASVAIALLVGRLDSKLIYPGYFPVIFMYLYAVIQMWFPFFTKEQGNELATALYLALFLKIIFFLYIYWSVHFHRLFYYFMRINRIQQNVEKHWNEFEPLIDSSEQYHSKK